MKSWIVTVFYYACNDLLFNKSNIESFNVFRSQGRTKSNFLEWTGLRQSVPLNLCVTLPNCKVVLDLESFKCHDYYCVLIKQKLEKPSKRDMLKKEFGLDNKQVSEAFHLPVRVANEPYLRSLQYFVFSKLFYCSTVWGNTSKSNIKKLQLVQNFAGKIVLGLKKFDHISQGPKSLGWLSIEDKLRLNAAVMVHKCLHHRVPIYLKDKICI